MRWIAILVIFSGCAASKPTVTVRHAFKDQSTTLEVKFEIP